MLGLGNTLTKTLQLPSGGPIDTMIVDFQSRVTTDSGATEGTSCLTAELETLNDIE